MITSSLPLASGVNRELVELRARTEDLQRQLATGKKSETYGGLGADRTLSLALRSRTASIEGYVSTINQASIRIETVTVHLSRLREIAADTRQTALTGEFDAIANGQTQLQVGAKIDLEESLALLNFEINGTHYFAGRDSSTRPVLTADEILDGNGAQAGLKQVISERRQADLGADGRGRLSVPVPVANVVSLSEDVAGSPFGVKLESVTGSLTGTTISGPTGAPPAIDFSFSATLPQDGEQIRLSFNLPDGTQASREFTARSNGPLGPGEFIIGADENITATNFQTILGNELEGLGRTELSSASAYAASDDFFNYDSATPPQRVDGPPFDTATALVDGTTTNTTFWYQGDAGPGNARDSAVARVDDNQSISYGVRANESAIVDTIAALAVLAAETLDPNAAETVDRYAALRDRAADRLSFPNGQQSLDDLVGELGFRQSALEQAKQRHDDTQVVLADFLADAEDADVYEVSAQILQLQTQLEASYRTTSILARLSLVNFL